MNFKVGEIYIYNFSKEQYFTSTAPLHQKLVRVVDDRQDSDFIQVKVIGDEHLFWSVSKHALECAVAKKLEEFLEIL